MRNILLIITVLLLINNQKVSGGSMINITSPDFEHNKTIPVEFTCQGRDINPKLVIENIPGSTRSLALIVDDPDAPGGTWVHWLIYNIPLPQSGDLVIKPNTVPGLEGLNDFGKINYGGPCPPSGTHRYFFKIYALDTVFNLKQGITKQELESAMNYHVIDSAELIGLYKKQ